MAGDVVVGLAAAERPSGGIRRLFGLWRLYAYMDLVWIARDFPRGGRRTTSPTWSSASRR